MKNLLQSSMDITNIPSIPNIPYRDMDYAGVKVMVQTAP